MAQPNEYVSMAGLVDSTMQGSPDGPIFCGAAISEKAFLLLPLVFYDFIFYLIFSS